MLLKSVCQYISMEIKPLTTYLAIINNIFRVQVPNRQKPIAVCQFIIIIIIIIIIISCLMLRPKFL